MSAAQRRNRDLERIRAMQRPTIDQWQQAHTVCCVSPLVTMLLGVAWDYLPNSSGNLGPPDTESVHEAISHATRCDECEGTGETVNDDGHDETCSECGGDEHTGEVYEFWVVDDCLANYLQGQGESLFDSDCIGILGHHVWCRTTTGQLIAADSCIEGAYKRFLATCYGGR